MLAVTIGVGPRYSAEAEIAAATARWSTGLETVVLTATPGEPIPAFYKLRLLEMFPGETILYFDADTRFLRRWDVAKHDGSPAFRAVLDWPSAARNEDCEAFGLDASRYVNTGIWIASPYHATAFHLASEICHATDYSTRFQYEQTALNAALERLGVPMIFVDRRYNAICSPRRLLSGEFPAEPVVLHRAGAGCKTSREMFEAILSREKAKAEP
jgi:lipopolysaccharide biosynthesis glycosyltransferase